MRAGCLAFFTSALVSFSFFFSGPCFSYINPSFPSLPFRTTKPLREGTSLSLNSVKIQADVLSPPDGLFDSLTLKPGPARGPNPQFFVANRMARPRLGLQSFQTLDSIAVLTLFVFYGFLVEIFGMGVHLFSCELSWVSFS